MPKRVAIFISGSGSNMVTIVKAMQSGSINAIPVIVISNNEAAADSKARGLGVATAMISNKLLMEIVAYLKKRFKMF